MVVFSGVAIVAVLLVTIAALSFAKSPAPWFSRVSKENGYPALVQGASKLKGAPPQDRGGVAAFVKENEAALREIRSALRLPFEVPADRYSLTNQPLPDFASFKTAALALRAEGWVVEEREQYAEAARIYADVIRLGQQVEHGPLIARLTGVAIERIGFEAMEKVEAKIPADARQELAGRLESLDAERLPFPEIAAREKYFMRRITGNPIKLLMARQHFRKAALRSGQREALLSSDFQRLAKELRR